jgi:hypothetical protein
LEVLFFPQIYIYTKIYSHTLIHLYVSDKKQSRTFNYVDTGGHDTDIHRQQMLGEGHDWAAGLGCDKVHGAACVLSLQSSLYIEWPAGVVIAPRTDSPPMTRWTSVWVDNGLLGVSLWVPLVARKL